MPYNQLFTVKPPQSVILRIARAFGIPALDDRKTDISAITMQHLDTITNLRIMEKEIMSYFIPCKKIRYASNFTHKRCITLFRQFLKTYGITLSYHEKLINGKKYNIYRLTDIPTNIQPSKFYIRFD